MDMKTIPVVLKDIFDFVPKVDPKVYLNLEENPCVYDTELQSNKRNINGIVVRD